MNDQTSPAYPPWVTLYGNPDGRWFLLTGPHESTPPSDVDGLGYLGSPIELIRLIHERRYTASQLELAELLCVRQQAVSRYLKRGGGVNLSARGWCNLVCAVFRVGRPAPVPV